MARAAGGDRPPRRGRRRRRRRRPPLPAARRARRGASRRVEPQLHGPHRPARGGVHPSARRPPRSVPDRRRRALRRLRPRPPRGPGRLHPAHVRATAGERVAAGDPRGPPPPRRRSPGPGRRCRLRRGSFQHRHRPGLPEGARRGHRLRRGLDRRRRPAPRRQRGGGPGHVPPGGRRRPPPGGALRPGDDLRGAARHVVSGRRAALLSGRVGRRGLGDRGRRAGGRDRSPPRATTSSASTTGSACSTAYRWAWSARAPPGQAP